MQMGRLAQHFVRSAVAYLLFENSSGMIIFCSLLVELQIVTGIRHVCFSSVKMLKRARIGETACFFF